MHYNIPASMAGDYHGRDIIVRAHDPSEFPKYLSKTDIKKIAYLQLLSLDCRTDGLARWGEQIPLDLIMGDPEKEFPLLYRFSNLLKKHPVRVTVPPLPGFSKAVRLAASLGFAVKIGGGQPAARLIREMMDTLDLYLRNPSVTQPIEYFHSLLIAFFHEKPVSLPAIQEEDPMYFRFITDQGEEAISGRFAAQGIVGETASADALSRLPEKNAECPVCEFLPHCREYFKWPDKDYSCEGVKTIFLTLKNASRELKKDAAASRDRTGG